MHDRSTSFGDLLATPLRNGVSYSTKERGVGICMVNMREMFANDRIADADFERAPLTEGELENCLLEDGDLLFARQSLSYEGAGKCTMVLPASERRTWESHLIRARLDPRKADPRYYYYYFRSSLGRKNIETIIQQVAAAGIRGSDLARLRVPSPDLPDQRAIAEVLGAIDDKIDVNVCVLECLDELVRGRYSSLSAESSVQLDSIASNVRKQVDPTSVDPSFRYVGLEHIDRRHSWLRSHGRAREVESAKNAYLAGDILFGKLRSYFHKVAMAGYAGICSTDVLVLRSRVPELRGFVLAASSADQTVASVSASAHGTRMPRASWADLGAVEVPWPGEPSARAFSAEVSNYADLAVAIVDESASLARTRDELLPLLMSGKTRVKDAEKVVEEVV